MQHFLTTLGAIGAILAVMIFCLFLWEVELVLPKTFESGKVEIDYETTYECKLDALSIQRREFKKKIKKMEDELKQVKK